MSLFQQRLGLLEQGAGGGGGPGPGGTERTYALPGAGDIHDEGDDRVIAVPGIDGDLSLGAS